MPLALVVETRRPHPTTGYADRRLITDHIANIQYEFASNQSTQSEAKRQEILVAYTSLGYDVETPQE